MESFWSDKKFRRCTKKLVIKNKNSDKFDTKFDRVDDEGEIYKQTVSEK